MSSATIWAMRPSALLPGRRCGNAFARSFRRASVEDPWKASGARFDRRGPGRAPSEKAAIPSASRKGKNAAR